MVQAGRLKALGAAVSAAQIDAAITAPELAAGIAWAQPRADIQAAQITLEAELDVRGLHFTLADAVSLADGGTLLLQTYADDYFADDYVGVIRTF